MADHIPDTNELELDLFRQRWRSELDQRKRLGRDRSTEERRRDQPLGEREDEEGTEGEVKGKGKAKAREEEVSGDVPPRPSSVDFERLSLHDSPSPLATPSRPSARPPIDSSARRTAGSHSGKDDDPAAPSAVSIYAHAVASERSGLMDDALQAYRKAFRLAPDVDRQYHRLTKDEVERLEAVGLEGGRGQGASRESRQWEFRFSRTLQVEDDYDPKAHGSEGKKEREGHQSSTAALAKVLSDSFQANPFVSVPKNKKPGFSHISTSTSPPPSVRPESILSPQSFHPSDPGTHSPLATLPPELLLSILLASAPSSPHSVAIAVETFASVSRRARLLTLDPALWRAVCERVYVAPGMGVVGGSKVGGGARERRVELERVCRKRHGGDWRRMYIEQCVGLGFPLEGVQADTLCRPRIRTDGCFISVVTYLRRGEGSVWNAPSHFVTYFRYLRFSLDGTVLSLLTTDPPASVVKRLDGRLRMKGLTRGRWELEGDEVRCFGLEEVGSAWSVDGYDETSSHAETKRAKAKATKAADHDADPSPGKYRFVMQCRLKSTQRGKMYVARAS